MKNKSQKKINIALSGDRGRMGQSLKRLIKKDSLKQVVAVANRSTSQKTWEEKQIDIVIDFSLPAMFSQTLNWCIKNKKPLVSGTTGLSQTQKQSLKLAAKKIPVFYAENMSWGIFCLSKCLLGLSGKSCSPVSVWIEDIHHINKKDKPSGTALKLKKHLPLDLQKIVKIKSERQGKELGTHRLFLKTKKESLMLEHRSMSRDLFSEGALKAAEFTLKKKKGLYSLENIYQ